MKSILKPIYGVFLMTSTLLWSQSTGVTSPYDVSGAVFVGDEDKEGEEEIQSLRDERREVLLYGIESEVIEVVDAIQGENDDSYNGELLMILKETENPALSGRIYSLLASFEDERAVETALDDLSPILEDYRYEESRVLAAITYLGDMGSNEAADLFYDLIKKDEPGLTGRVIYNLGKLKDDSRAAELEELYEEYQGDESNDIAINIISAWGEMGYAPAYDILIEIIEDTSAAKTEREYAAVALGKLGDRRALEPLIGLYHSESGNSMIRAFAISGLMYFEDERVEDLLLQALKRDSYWKIRVASCEGLAKMKSEDAVDVLDFKLRRDSEKNVQKAAAKALGEIGLGRSQEYLLDYYAKESHGAELRLAVLDVLLKHRIPGTIDVLSEIFTAHWNKRDTQLEFLKRTSQALSKTEWPDLSSLYGRMLTHVDNYIQIYGIRGIRINNLTDLYGTVKDLDKEGVNSLVRREAKSLE